MAKKASKRHRKNLELVEKGKVYPLTEAVAVLKKVASAKFNETVELHIKLGVDPKKADQQVRGTVILAPWNRQDPSRGGLGQRREGQGSRGGRRRFRRETTNLIEKIAGGFLDFDVLVATPDIMRETGKLGKVLGPKGLMPNPKAGTVTPDVARAVKEIKAGKIEYRVDEQGICHAGIGKIQFNENQIVENAETLIKTLVSVKPASAKGNYLLSAYITSSMGPGIKVDTSEFMKTGAKLI